MDITFIVFVGLDGHFYVSECPVAVWPVISEYHLSSQHQGGYLLLTANTRGGDKSLARPGRKQVAAIKLGIYSTHSPRSSLHFLARWSNFCLLLKKFRRMSVQPGIRGSNDLRVGRKMTTFQLFFFSVQGTGGSSTGLDSENRVGDQGWKPR